MSGFRVGDYVETRARIAHLGVVPGMCGFVRGCVHVDNGFGCHRLWCVEFADGSILPIPTPDIMPATHPLAAKQTEMFGEETA